MDANVDNGAQQTADQAAPATPTALAFLNGALGLAQALAVDVAVGASAFGAGGLAGKIAGGLQTVQTIEPAITNLEQIGVSLYTMLHMLASSRVSSSQAQG